ncbi:MAG TPA: 3-dehydroquinate synthase [Geminicoccaceae bacterium]|nr:3-dehydroquinate synthase [Geminicoccaceae bacterium]
MTGASRLRVELGDRSYEIVVGPGLLARAGGLLRPLLRQHAVVIVTDDHLAQTGHLAALESSLEAAAIVARRVVLPAGEATKSMAGLERLLDQILAQVIERRTALVAFGGGVIGDLAGFAAAILLRGLDHVQIPTTLLAQVDSAVGGKTGINARHGKNLIGSFHQPRLVLADVDTLESLPVRELRAGYAEVVKYGLIDRPEFFAWLERNGAALLAGDAALRQHAILESCRAKAALVAADEREAGARALLNLGHTFGHALEALAGYGEALLHGEAVALGIVLAAKLSVRLGLCPPADAERIREHFTAAGLPVTRAGLPAPVRSAEAMLAAMARDKKVEGGRPRFVLLRGIGRAFAGAEVDPAELTALLSAAEP